MADDTYDAAKTWYKCPRCGAHVGPDDVERACDGRATIVGCTECPDRIEKLDEWK